MSYYVWVFVMCGFCSVWLCVCVGSVMCGCFDNCVGVLVICVLVFTVFCIVCTVFFYCFVYVYSYLLLVYGLLPPSDNYVNCS
jgi:hypothetical protein